MFLNADVTAEEKHDQSGLWKRTVSYDVSICRKSGIAIVEPLKVSLLYLNLLICR